MKQHRIRKSVRPKMGNRRTLCVEWHARSARDLRPRLESGFTLIELLIVLLILTVILALAAPGVLAVINSYERLTVQQQFRADVRRAKSEAIQRGTRGILEVNPSGGEYSFGFDFIPYASPPETEMNSFVRRLPYGVTITPADTLIFDARGYLVDESGNFTTQSYSLVQNGTSYTSATVYPTGAIEFQ